MKRYNWLACTLASALFLVGCKDSPPPTPQPPPSDGFLVRTFEQDFVNGIPTAPARIVPGISFAGKFEFQVPNALFVGIHNTCGGTTDPLGFFPCPNVTIPGVWSFIELSGPCFGRGDILEQTIFPRDHVFLVCKTNLQTFLVIPDTEDVNSTSPTIEMTGVGMDSTYGMPVIQFGDWGGNVVASTNTTAINSDGTWVQAPTPYLGNIYSGTYLVVVSNVQADGSLMRVGAAWMVVMGNEPPPPPPPDPDPTPCGDGPCLIY
jgi:hypothetical protein